MNVTRETDVDDLGAGKSSIESEEKQKWTTAINDELESMKKNKVWTVVKLPENRKAVSCKWVFKVKMKENNKIEKFKRDLQKQMS